MRTPVWIALGRFRPAFPALLLALCLSSSPAFAGAKPAKAEAARVDSAEMVASDASNPRKTSPPPVSSADPLDWNDQANRRALNGHYFLPSDLVPAPFTTTHFGSTTSFGYGRIDLMVEYDDGTTDDLSLKLVAIQQSLDLQVMVGEVGPAAFALRIQASGSATVGINAESALNAPLSLGYDFGLGFLVKAWGNRYFQLGLSLDYQRGTAYMITPLRALENTVNQGSLTADGLLSTQVTNDILPALSMAVSPHRVLGLVTSLRYDWQYVEGVGSANALNWSLMGGLDFGAVSKAAIGLQAVYVLEKGLGGNGSLVHWGGGGLFYTGRPHMSLGVEVVATQSSPAPGVDQLLIMGQFRLRYYW